jgi:oligosaccharide repeat unit polymerase
MNWLLLLMLLVLIAIDYLIGNNDVLFPGFIATGVFLVSALFLVMNPAWNYEISVETTLFIVAALTFFSLGATIGIRFNIYLHKKKIKGFSIDSCSLDITRKWSVLINLISIGTTLGYAYHQYVLARSIGTVTGLFGIILLLRTQVLINPDIFQLGIILNIALAFTRANGYINLFFLIKKIVYKEKMINKHLIPVVCLALCAILTTGRSSLITIVVSSIFDIFFCLRACRIQSINKKITKYIFIGIIGFFVVFRVLGILTEKTGGLNLWDNISVYAGSSILCFDSYFIHRAGINANFGQNSFIGIYNILNRLVLPFGQASNNAEFVFWSKYSSNVYTSLKPYVADFGVLGTLLLELYLGIFFGTIWNKYKSKAPSLLLIITYGRFFGFPLTMYSISENILSQNLALNAFAEMFFYAVIIHFFIKPIINEKLIN